MFSDRVFLFLEIILNFYSGWSLIFQSFYFSVFYRRRRQVGFFVSRRVTHQLQEHTRRPGGRAGGGFLRSAVSSWPCRERWCEEPRPITSLLTSASPPRVISHRYVSWIQIMMQIILPTTAKSAERSGCAPRWPLLQPRLHGHCDTNLLSGAGVWSTEFLFDHQSELFTASVKLFTVGVCVSPHKHCLSSNPFDSILISLGLNYYSGSVWLYGELGTDSGGGGRGGTHIRTCSDQSR